LDAIAIHGVEKRFDGHQAVSDLSLVVPKGSIYGFIGPNGSGKTTTLRMIMNILLPDRGHIEVLGAQSSSAVRDRVSYLPEERGLYKRMTVRQLLTYFGELKGVSRGKLAPRIARYVEQMALGDWLDRKIETLSKGMSQKVQFIAAVIAGPELLILDEPFSGLDPVNAEVLREAVLEQKQEGATIVFSTHDMNTAEKMCDRIFMIFRGRKVLDGTLDEIQSAHGTGTVRVRTPMGRAALEGLSGIESTADAGAAIDVKLACDAQDFLRRLHARTAIEQFELVRPSLNEIFVRIARPEMEGVGS
jgi:ABC-2 type transport system ATP-binding protein